MELSFPRTFAPGNESSCYPLNDPEIKNHVLVNFCYFDVKFGYPLQNSFLFYCTLYTDSPDGITDAVARHESIAEITFLI